MKIGGKTSVCGLVGNPVAHSVSPGIHNSLSEKLGIDSVYVTFPVENPEALGNAVRGAYALGIKGLNITVPYKKDVMEFLSEIDTDAEAIGAVNTLVRTGGGYKGYNTDVLGVFETLARHEIDLSNKSLLLLGAGGGANAAAFAALKKGARKIYIAKRSNNNAELLASRIKKYYNVDVILMTYDKLHEIREEYFIIQATSVGMGSATESPLSDMRVIEKSCGVFDIIYTPPKTKILADAESFGRKAINGYEMLIYQALAAYELWHTVEIDRRSVAETLIREVWGCSN